MINLIRFLNLMMAALVAGSIFGIWIGYNPHRLSAQAYIEQQQGAILSLNTLMPLLGLVTILLTLANAFLQQASASTFRGLIVATIFLVASGLVTRFGNQPINSLVINWDPGSPPDNWMVLRDKWWSFHMIRTLSALIALALIVWFNMQKD
jgi:uncharacterized membrane protein